MTSFIHDRKNAARFAKQRGIVSSQFVIECVTNVVGHEACVPCVEYIKHDDSSPHSYHNLSAMFNNKNDTSSEPSYVSFGGTFESKT